MVGDKSGKLERFYLPDVSQLSTIVPNIWKQIGKIWDGQETAKSPSFWDFPNILVWKPILRSYITDSTC